MRFDNYRDVLAIRPFRRLFLGQGLSGLGDGFGFIAVAWLALELAPPAGRPYAIGLAIGAYSLPGALLGLAVAGRMASLQPKVVLVADAVLRGVLLAAIPVLYLLRDLPLGVYIGLLAGSSLLGAAGRGGFVSVVAGLVPESKRFSANSLLASTEAVTLTLAGPALGGVLVATIGAPATIAIDAATFGALLWAAATLPGMARTTDPAPTPVSLRTILRRPLIAWLLALTVVFYGLYGPIETALPLYVQRELGGGAALYGGLWAAFGVGAVIATVVVGTRTVVRVERFALAVVAGWGLCMIVAGATSSSVVVAAAMAAGGLIYAPYPAITTTSLQGMLPSRELAAGAAGWFAILSAVTPATTAAGGPLVAAVGPRVTILGSGIATIALAALVTAVKARGPKVGIEMLEPDQITHFKTLLIQERRAIEARIAARQGDITGTVRNEDGAGDKEDEAQRIYGREDGIVSNELDAQQLEQVNKALARIEAGTYGMSEVSGKPIPLERLEAVPSATTLVSEQSD